MNEFFTFFQQNSKGIFNCFISLLGLLFLINYFTWLFSIGRYKKSPNANSNKSTIAYILTEMVVKIITDFRHFLALVLVIIFAITLMYACAIADNDVDNLSKAMQTVVASLGGLVGSIVGYYFGESAAKSKQRELEKGESSTNNIAVQNESVESIQEPEGLE